MQWLSGGIHDRLWTVRNPENVSGGVETVRMSTRGTLVEWTKNVDEGCIAGDVIAVIQTEETSIEIPITFSGVITEQLAAIGDTLEVDAPLFKIDTSKTKGFFFTLDLHFKDSLDDPERRGVIYVLATPNELQHRKTQQWKVVNPSECFLSATQIRSRYGIDEDQLPLSSREQQPVGSGKLLKALCDLSQGERLQKMSRKEVKRMVDGTKFVSKSKMKKKFSARQKCVHRDHHNDDQKENKESRCKCPHFETDSVDNRMCTNCGHHAAEHGIEDNEELQPTVELTLREWKKCVVDSCVEDKRAIPAMVIEKGHRNQVFVEWKKFVTVPKDGRMWSVGISLKYDSQKTRWSIECIDMDPGRVYYQHRLISDFVDDDLRMGYGELVDAITAKMHKKASR